MGRYYNGDIEGKFWFGVQSSTDADFFGVSHTEPNYVEYFYEKEDDMEGVKEGIAKCLVELGTYTDRLDKFFDSVNSYNDEQLMEELGVNKDKVRDLLEWYARLKLGMKILKCLEETGTCEFQAEL